MRRGDQILVPKDWMSMVWRLGLEYIPSFGNFITVRVGDADRVYNSMLREGVIVRPIGGYGMPGHLRVTVGLPEHNERFLAALERALARK